MRKNNNRKTNKPADQKALELLLYKDRTVKELREKLSGYDYSEEEIESAIRSAAGYGYLNDERYARNYISLNKKRQSRSSIIFDLKKKGISEQIIEEAVSETEFDEDNVVFEMILKRAGEPHRLDEKEYRRLFGYAARRGFSQGLIHKALRRYIEESTDEYHA